MGKGSLALDRTEMLYSLNKDCSYSLLESFQTKALGNRLSVFYQGQAE